MKRVIVNYRVKPDRVEENEALVRAVYEELAETEPDRINYATFKLDDGVSFVHISKFEPGEDAGLSGLAAFKEFQREIQDRCDEPPVVTPLEEIGSYRFFHSR